MNRIRVNSSRGVDSSQLEVGVRPEVDMRVMVVVVSEHRVREMLELMLDNQLWFMRQGVVRMVRQPMS